MFVLVIVLVTLLVIAITVFGQGYFVKPTTPAVVRAEPSQWSHGIGITLVEWPMGQPPMPRQS